MTLAEFLTARLDEDQAIWSEGLGLITKPQFARLSRNVLADVAAKRRIVAEHPIYDLPPEPCCATCGSDDLAGSLTGDWPCATLRLLALPYKFHPDYDQEWKP